ncbi:MAG: hypothetical protein NTV48_00565, partial [Candidatus Vogelbacteria bacterium]|nr:hypothetical protein [Candidatus Vogelbacteria bacterium]
LLFAILISGVVSIVGILLINIVTKQLIFSSVNRDSEISYYYLANSGRECLEYNLASNLSSFFKKPLIFAGHPRVYNVVFQSPPTLSCFGTDDVVLLVDDTDSEVPIYSTNNVLVSDGSVSRYVDFQVQFNKKCILGDCVGDSLLDKSIAVMTVNGYNLKSGPRATKRTAVSMYK